MKFYFITSTDFDFDTHYERFDADLGPRHAFYELAKKSEAEIVQPGSVEPKLIHKFLALFISEPNHWALADEVSRLCDKDDRVYCQGEDTSIPFAVYKRLRGRKFRLATYFMNPENIRVKFFMRFLRLRNLFQLFTVTDKNKRQRLNDLFGINLNRVTVIPEQTDQLFFRPLENLPDNPRFLIASAGMEQRDYITLSEAISDLDLDVKICAHSPNLTSKTKVSFPEVVPENMEIRYFDFSELRELYCSADVVIISLLDNPYSAGLTVLMEAMACKTPVIITNNIGLGRDFIEKGLVLGVRPGDVNEMRNKIVSLMTDQTLAKNYAEKAYAYFSQNHRCEDYLDRLVSDLQVLSDQ